MTTARFAVGLAGLLLVPAVAHANSVTSENWAGYAVHRNGVSFRSVTATWRQPAATCRTGTATYSAFWIGIGGYNLASDAIEQIGSELDCRAGASESMSAWYELVPSPSHQIRMAISAGDLLAATVTVAGKRVTLTLADRTEHESFSKSVIDGTVDVSSAEWIAEAPSGCASACTTLPLTDFGSVRFSTASAETTSGTTGSVSSPRWWSTKIVLRSSGHATPSALADGGRAFIVATSALR